MTLHAVHIVIYNIFSDAEWCIILGYMKMIRKVKSGIETAQKLIKKN